MDFPRAGKKDLASKKMRKQGFFVFLRIAFFLFFFIFGAADYAD